ncbi:restriction endonuclease subunit S [Streptomyces sp. AS58]|uniref:restriction endonuclease subunit S n=1 Tax=Streptomyces sp. AS58 TaxID=1519489 RepID=UPI00099C7307|nr:restriction endonuclease subunit S [Streptomyces sp. AS58]
MSDREPVIRPEADWPVRPLGDLVTVLRRGRAPVYVEDSDVKAIGQRCVTHADFDGSRSRPHSAKAMSNVLEPQAGDVLVNSTGTGTIGRSVIFREDGARYVVDGHVTVARPREKDLIGRWLNDILRSPQGQRYLEARCYAGSTNQIELSSSALAAMPVAAPMVDEQRRIAEVLDALDRQIRITSELVKKFRLQADGLLDDLVAAIPEGRREPLADLCVADICYGIVQSGQFVAGGVPVLSIRDLSGDFETGLHRTNPAIDAQYRRSRVAPGDVLLSIKGTIGRVGVAPEHYMGNVSRELARIRFGKNVVPEFARLYFLSREAQRRLDLAVVGTTRAEVSIHVLKKFGFPVPSPERQRRMVAAYHCIEKRIVAEEQGLKKLRTMKLGLADDLLTGRVRLPAEAVS